jgi:hypothetical protein
MTSAESKLESAAPELLAALKEALSVLDLAGRVHAEYHGTTAGPSIVGAAYIRAKAAIRMAESA